MDQERIADIRARAEALYRRGRERLAKVPVTMQVVGAFVLFAALLMAICTAIGSRDATMRLKVQHSFRSAQLEVWVDDSTVYSGHLVGTFKKKYGLLPDVQGSLSETLAVPSGSHRVKVRVTADDGAIQEDTIDAQFSRNTQRTLSVVARHSDVSLNMQGTIASTPPDPPPASSSWFTRYAGTLMLTAAGSIISALTGYAVRELPGHIRARQSAASQTPKAEA
jgi:hypothetical protein